MRFAVPLCFALIFSNSVLAQEASPAPAEVSATALYRIDMGSLFFSTTDSTTVRGIDTHSDVMGVQHWFNSVEGDFEDDGKGEIYMLQGALITATRIPALHIGTRYGLHESNQKHFVRSLSLGSEASYRAKSSHRSSNIFFTWGINDLFVIGLDHRFEQQILKIDFQGSVTRSRTGYESNAYSLRYLQNGYQILLEVIPAVAFDDALRVEQEGEVSLGLRVLLDDSLIHVKTTKKRNKVANSNLRDSFYYELGGGLKVAQGIHGEILFSYDELSYKNADGFSPNTIPAYQTVFALMQDVSPQTNWGGQLALSSSPEVQRKYSGEDYIASGRYLGLSLFLGHEIL